MEEERKRIYTVVGVVAVVALLLSCVAGALAGGLVGLLAGRQQGRLAAERAIAARPFVTRVPQEEESPFPMPGPEEEMPPFGPEFLGMEGAIIVEVLPGTPAEDAGFREGDVIVAVDEVPIDRNHPLADVIGEYQPGDRVRIEFWRAGESQTARVELAENPDNASRPYLGIRYQMNQAPDFNLPGG